MSMKLWNCYATMISWGELDSIESYGIFSSREKVVEKITKEYKIGRLYNDGDYTYHWVISRCPYYGINNEVYQEEITLTNIAADGQETICFVITKEEVDKGV